MTGARSRVMDYKTTLNLPGTDFPMRANLPQREPEMLKRWEDERLYERMQERRADAPRFLLHDGPPYANGNIHIGHALNKILKDIVTKYRSLAGFQTPYRPGWDCHGLPIELEVEKKLGRSKRAELGVAGVREKCHQYAERFVGIQREDFKRLGVLGSWDRPYLTNDRKYEAREIREFAAVVASGGVYRGRKPVHWCARCRTALAEAEVDYDEHGSTSVYVAFEVIEPAGVLAEHAELRPAVAIWTTTPWTLPANQAIAVHPDFEYVLVETEGRPVILAEGMVEGLRERLKLGAELCRLKGSELEGVRTRHPWIDRESGVVTADYVTLEAGTGCVHTAPGHGHDDYLTGQRYGLDTYAPVDAGGRFTSDVPEFEGTSVFEADEAIVELLSERGALLARQDIHHSYPHCWRCKRPIIFRATAQWFLSMSSGDLRDRALSEIDRVGWIPSWGRERIHGMIANRPDWCLSRQRAWGVPVTALRCRSCDDSFTSEAIALRAAEIFEEHGSDAWFTRPIEEFLPEGTACPDCKGTDLERDSDILDVWFDSGVSFSSVVEADHGEGTVADLYLEGSDQHRGWFHSALLTSIATRERAPYTSVLTHGFVLDGESKKMSKSLGNVIAPQQIIKQYGADILRLWVAAEDYRDDVRISEEILKRLADSYRRVRNTARNLLGNLAGFDPQRHRVAVSDMPELDRWILGRLADFVGRCRKAYDNYEFHVVYHALNNFCAVDLSSLYFDIVKDRLYCSSADSLERRSAQTVMYDTLDVLARVIAPVLSFTADEIWKSIPGAERADSVFLTDFPEIDPAWVDEGLAGRWSRLWELRHEVTRSLEFERKEGRIGHSLDARVELAVGSDDQRILSGISLEDLAAIYIVSEVDVVPAEDNASKDRSTEVEVKVETARGAKCGRCWNYRETVGQHDDHPEICDRCHAVVVSVA